MTPTGGGPDQRHAGVHVLTGSSTDRSAASQCCADKRGMKMKIDRATAQMKRYDRGYQDGHAGKVERSQDEYYRQGYSAGMWLRFDDLTEGSGENEGDS